MTGAAPMTDAELRAAMDRLGAHAAACENDAERLRAELRDARISAAKIHQSETARLKAALDMRDASIAALNREVARLNGQVSGLTSELESARESRCYEC